MIPMPADPIPYQPVSAGHAKALGDVALWKVHAPELGAGRAEHGASLDEYDRPPERAPVDE